MASLLILMASTRGMSHLLFFAAAGLTFLLLAARTQASLMPHTFCASKIYTSDLLQPVADCLTITGDTIIDVFNKSSSHFREIKRAAFLDGILIPGFIDSHGHIVHYGEVLDGVNLQNTRSIQDAVNRVVEYKKSHNRSGSLHNWIRGMGWNHEDYDRVMPTAANLSHAPELKDLFIMLDSRDVHCKWVSDAVLQLLPKNLPDVPGGEIIRDPGLGVFCNKAMDIVLEKTPQISQTQNIQHIQLAMSELNKVGFTGIHDAGMEMDVAETFADMAVEGLLTLRVYGMLKCATVEEFCFRDDTVRKIETSNKMFTLKSVKLFADNTLGSWGAALLEPYTDKPDSQGKLNLNTSSLNDFIAKIYEDGWQINVHAIGDRANQVVLDAFERVIGHCDQSNGETCNSRRLRIEHAQIMTLEDQARMTKLGIIASIMPTHATSDMFFAVERLGSKRLANEAFRQKTLIDRPYSRVILGSDFPVEPPTPFGGMYAAVTRLSPITGTSPHGPEGWFKEERISVEEAFARFTREAAYGSFWEGRAGQIKEGGWADFVLVDKDFFLEDVDLRNVKVQATWVGGKKVWDGGVDSDTDTAAQTPMLQITGLQEVFQ